MNYKENLSGKKRVGDDRYRELLENFDAIIECIYGVADNRKSQVSELSVTVLEQCLKDWHERFSGVPVIPRDGAQKIIAAAGRKNSRPGLSARVIGLAVVSFFLIFGLIFIARISFLTSPDLQQVVGEDSILRIDRELGQGDYQISPGQNFRVTSGRALIRESVPRSLESGVASKLYLETSILSAEFDIAGTIDLVIQHPLVRIKVLGTKFSVDLQPRKGSVKVSQGSVEVRHISGKILKVRAGQTIYFDDSKMDISGGAVPRKDVVREFHFKNGNNLFGTVKKETSNSLHIRTKEGITIIVNKDDLVL